MNDLVESSNLKRVDDLDAIFGDEEVVDGEVKIGDQEFIVLMTRGDEDSEVKYHMQVRFCWTEDGNSLDNPIYHVDVKADGSTEACFIGAGHEKWDEDELINFTVDDIIANFVSGELPQEDYSEEFLDLVKMDEAERLLFANPRTELPDIDDPGFRRAVMEAFYELSSKVSSGEISFDGNPLWRVVCQIVDQDALWDLRVRQSGPHSEVFQIGEGGTVEVGVDEIYTVSGAVREQIAELEVGQWAEAKLVLDGDVVTEISDLKVLEDTDTSLADILEPYPFPETSS